MFVAAVSSAKTTCLEFQSPFCEFLKRQIFIAAAVQHRSSQQRELAVPSPCPPHNPAWYFHILYVCVLGLKARCRTFLRTFKFRTTDSKQTVNEKLYSKSAEKASHGRNVASAAVLNKTNKKYTQENAIKQNTSHAQNNTRITNKSKFTNEIPLNTKSQFLIFHKLSDENVTNKMTKVCILMFLGLRIHHQRQIF